MLVAVVTAVLVTVAAIVRTARSHLTLRHQGDDQLFGVIEQNAPETEAVVRTEVIASSIVRTAPGRVDVLVFVNRPNEQQAADRPRGLRDHVTVPMVLQDGEWLVNDPSTTPLPARSGPGSALIVHTSRRGA